MQWEMVNIPTIYLYLLWLERDISNSTLVGFWKKNMIIPIIGILIRTLFKHGKSKWGTRIMNRNIHRWRVQNWTQKVSKSYRRSKQFQGQCLRPSVSRKIAWLACFFFFQTYMKRYIKHMYRCSNVFSICLYLRTFSDDTYAYFECIYIYIYI